MKRQKLQTALTAHLPKYTALDIANFLGVEATTIAGLERALNQAESGMCMKLQIFTHNAEPEPALTINIWQD